MSPRLSRESASRQLSRHAKRAAEPGLEGGRDDRRRRNRVDRDRLAVAALQRFQAHEPRVLIAVTADVGDLHARIELARDAVESLVGMFLWERCAAPLEE